MYILREIEIDNLLELETNYSDIKSFFDSFEKIENEFYTYYEFLTTECECDQFPQFSSFKYRLTFTIDKNGVLELRDYIKDIIQNYIISTFGYYDNIEDLLFFFIKEVKEIKILSSYSFSVIGTSGTSGASGVTYTSVYVNENENIKEEEYGIPFINRKVRHTPLKIRKKAHIRNKSPALSYNYKLY